MLIGHIQKVFPRIVWLDLFDQESRDVAVFLFRVLDNVFSEVSSVEVLAGLDLEFAPVPGELDGSGVGADLHLEADVAAADGLHLLGHGVVEDLGDALRRNRNFDF